METIINMKTHLIAHNMGLVGSQQQMRLTVVLPQDSDEIESVSVTAKHRQKV